jgi:methyl coenzyme M reductase beta subunit
MSNTYSNLKFEIIEVGGNDGTWGPIVNTNVGTAIEQAIVGMATLATGDFAANVCTLTLTNTNAAQNARAACLNITATLSAAGTLNVPAIQKPYIILNNSVGGFAVTVKVSGLTGVAIPAGKACMVYNNGTDVVAANNYLSS